MLERYAAMLAADKADEERRTAIRLCLQLIDRLASEGKIADREVEELKTVPDLRKLIELAGRR